MESLVCKQAEQCAVAKPEIQLCRKRAPSPTPNLHSHRLPSPCIHHPIHHRLYSTAWPPLLDSATLSNRPDGLNEIHPTVHSHLNHSQPLLSCYSNAILFQHSFAKVVLQNQPSTMSLARLVWGNVQVITNQRRRNVMPLKTHHPAHVVSWPLKNIYFKSFPSTK